jgi:hypothetical protein
MILLLAAAIGNQKNVYHGTQTERLILIDRGFEGQEVIERHAVGKKRQKGLQSVCLAIS